MVKILAKKWVMDLKLEEVLLMVIVGGLGSWGGQLRHGSWCWDFGEDGTIE